MSTIARSEIGVMFTNLAIPNWGTSLYVTIHNQLVSSRRPAISIISCPAQDVLQILGVKGYRTFLDKVCVDQSDEEKKREGIGAITAFLPLAKAAGCSRCCFGGKTLESFELIVSRREESWRV